MFTFNPRNCPKCGGHPGSIVERLVVYANIEPVDGFGKPDRLGYEYGGDSEVNWNSQEPWKEDDKVSLICVDCSHRWDASMSQHYNAEDMARAIHAESLAKSEGR
jgi:hypothetical protein